MCVRECYHYFTFYPGMWYSLREQHLQQFLCRKLHQPQSIHPRQQHALLPESIWSIMTREYFFFFYAHLKQKNITQNNQFVKSIMCFLVKENKKTSQKVEKKFFITICIVSPLCFLRLSFAVEEFKKIHF